MDALAQIDGFESGEFHAVNFVSGRSGWTRVTTYGNEGHDAYCSPRSPVALFEEIFTCLDPFSPENVEGTRNTDLWNGAMP